MTTEAIERVALLPCPFCAGERLNTEGAHVICIACSATGPWLKERGSSGITRLWNTRAAIAALSDAERGWMPIESAPKDGTRFDVWIASDGGGYRLSDVYFSAFTLRRDGDCGSPWLPYWPTHWQPLPEPPAAGEAVHHNQFATDLAAEKRGMERAAVIAEASKDASRVLHNAAAKDRDSEGTLVHGESWRTALEIAAAIRAEAERL